MQKLAAILADISPAECSLEAALEALRIASRTAAANLNRGTRLHPTLGIVIEDRNLAVRNGPLFVRPEPSPSDDHGWGDVVAEQNGRLKS